MAYRLVQTKLECRGVKVWAVDDSDFPASTDLVEPFSIYCCFLFCCAAAALLLNFPSSFCGSIHVCSYWL